MTDALDEGVGMGEAGQAWRSSPTVIGADRFRASMEGLRFLHQPEMAAAADQRVVVPGILGEGRHRGAQEGRGVAEPARA